MAGEKATIFPSGEMAASLLRIESFVKRRSVNSAVAAGPFGRRPTQRAPAAVKSIAPNAAHFNQSRLGISLRTAGCSGAGSASEFSREAEDLTAADWRPPPPVAFRCTGV